MSRYQLWEVDFYTPAMLPFLHFSTSGTQISGSLGYIIFIYSWR